MQTTALPAKVPFYYSPYFIGAVILVIIIALYWNGFFVTTKTEKAKSKSRADEEHDTRDGDADKFIASGGRSDSNGEDSGLIDRIHTDAARAPAAYGPPARPLPLDRQHDFQCLD